MKTRRQLWLTAPVLGILVCGCQEPTQRLNAPPQGAVENRHPMRANMVYMADNAMLQDMSMSDIHFVPHVAVLNGTGARRLNRFAELMIMHGGTLHLYAKDPESELAETRIELVKEYLAQAGVDMDSISVEFGLSRSEGVSAETAIAIQEKGTAQEQGSSGSFTPTGFGSGSSSTPTGM